MQRGFTLIEVMIVILILAILVAIAVPVYLNSRQNAVRRTCQSNQRTVDSAIQTYQAMFDPPTFPNSLDCMLQDGTRTLKSECVPPQGGTYDWASGNPPHISCPHSANHTI